ncbi:MAG: hypothetical protein AAFY19_00805 [Pseudomonadota bacterium]
MAKDAKDTGDDNAPSVYTVPTKTDFESMLAKYDNLADEKGEIADQQKSLLNNFNQSHSCPPEVSKMLRKIRGWDEPQRSDRLRALFHGIETMGLNAQDDMLDGAPTPPKPSGSTAANDGAEQWPDDKAVAGNA